jgi:hypothetical protein
MTSAVFRVEPTVLEYIISTHIDTNFKRINVSVIYRSCPETVAFLLEYKFEYHHSPTARIFDVIIFKPERTKRSQRPFCETMRGIYRRL